MFRLKQALMSLVLFAAGFALAAPQPVQAQYNLKPGQTTYQLRYNTGPYWETLPWTHATYQSAQQSITRLRAYPGMWTQTFYHPERGGWIVYFKCPSGGVITGDYWSLREWNSNLAFYTNGKMEGVITNIRYR